MNLMDLVQGAEESAPEEWGEFTLMIELPDGQELPVKGVAYDPDETGALRLRLDWGPYVVRKASS
jgi:hypothetical protein